MTSALTHEVSDGETSGLAQVIDIRNVERAAIGTGPDGPSTPVHHAPYGRNVAVVGLGYVGLPTALALAEGGSSVLGCDVSHQRLDSIRAGAVDVLASDRKRLTRHLGTGLQLTDEAAGLAQSDTVIICVPTPIDVHLAPDLRALACACATVVANAVSGQLIILTSTSYVGTTRDLLIDPLASRGLMAGRDVWVAFSPERIDSGNPVHLPESTPRVVGGSSEGCRDRAAQALAHTAPSLHTVSSPEAAEMTKLMENSFRAVNIAFANEMADVSRRLGLDISEVVEAAATKPFGFMRFTPGPGVGGHCIPCDPHYLLWQLRSIRMVPGVTAAAMNAIAARPLQMVTRVREELADSGIPVLGARILVVGVTYKPNVDDVRSSPALEIMTELVELGAQVGYVDSHVRELRIRGQVLVNTHAPTVGAWDLLLIHTLHRDASTDWVDEHPRVLDATYQLSTTNRYTVP